jgi:hypothetical protein
MKEQTFLHMKSAFNNIWMSYFNLKKIAKEVGSRFMM